MSKTESFIEKTKDAALFMLFGVAVGTFIGLALIFVNDVFLK